MQRRDFTRWLAVLPFLRQLPKTEPALPLLYDPPPKGSDIVEAVHPPMQTAVCIGDTRGLWGNGASSE